MFEGTYTRASSTAANQFGQDVAAFMLGIPTGGSVARNAQRLNTTPYHGVFVQDDWRIGAKLTLNLGLRYEYEGATSDAQNRNVRGFDPTAAIAINAAARAAYAASPIPELSVAAFNPQGGVQFASDDHPGFYNADTSNFQPRAGLRLFAERQDRPARRMGHVYRAGHHLRQLPAGLLADDAGRDLQRQRLDLPWKPGQRVRRWRDRAGWCRARRQHVPRAGSPAVRAHRLQQRAEHALHHRDPARAARTSGWSKGPMWAAAAGI